MITKRYTVIFYFTVKFDELEFKSKNLEVSFEASDMLYPHELRELAFKEIKKRYKKLFDYDNFLINIIGIE